MGEEKMKKEKCSLCGGKMKVLAGGIGVNYEKCKRCGFLKSFLRIGPLPQRGIKRGGE